MSKPGFLKPSELTRVQGNIYLGNATANAFLAMRDDAAEQDHVNITLAEPGGGYRTMALTLAMRANPAKYNVTPGIVPSLFSLHMEGIAGDIVGGLAWIKKNGHKYGFTFPLRGDPNHSVHDGTTMAGEGTRIGSELDMTDTKYYWTDEGGTEYVIYGRELPGGFESTKDVYVAQAYGIMFGTPEGAPWDKLPRAKLENTKVLAARLAAARVAEQKSICGGSGGGSTDLAPVLEAVAGVSEQISEFPAPPTAEAIATAVNTDAAQRLAQ